MHPLHLLLLSAVSSRTGASALFADAVDVLQVFPDAVVLDGQRLLRDWQGRCQIRQEQLVISRTL